MAGTVSHCRREAVFLTAMLATETGVVGINTLFKVATSKGLNLYAFLGYSYLLASLLLLPSLFFSNRSRSIPPLSFSILCKIGLLGFLGSMYVITGYVGIKYSNPTLASAISNITPALTFLLAVIFRAKIKIFNRLFKMGDHKNKKAITALDYIKNKPKLQGQPLSIQNSYSTLAEFPPFSYSKAATSEIGQSSSKTIKTTTQKSAYYLKPHKQHLATTQFDKPITLREIQNYTNKLYYPESQYPTDNITKTRSFYEYILVDSKSAEITHHPNKQNPEIISHSTCKILRIATIRDLGFLHHHTQKDFSQPGFHIPGYTYIDYQHAFFRAFYHRSYDHSWWITFDVNCPKALPGWFFEWWYWFGPVDQ